MSRGVVPGCGPGCSVCLVRVGFGSRAVPFGGGVGGVRLRAIARCGGRESACVGLSLVGGAWGSGVQLWWGVRCRVPRVAIKAWASRWLPVTLSACRHPPFACNLNPSLALRGTAGRVGLSAASIKRALGALPKTLPPSLALAHFASPIGVSADWIRVPARLERVRARVKVGWG